MLEAQHACKAPRAAVRSVRDGASGISAERTARKQERVARQPLGERQRKSHAEQQGDSSRSTIGKEHKHQRLQQTLPLPQNSLHMSNN